MKFRFAVPLLLASLWMLDGSHGIASTGPLLPSPVVSVLPSPVPERISAAEGSKLRSQFVRAQKNELKGVDHLQNTELKELKASQSARRKEFEVREKEARHLFFKQNTDGPTRRAFVKDFLQRRKAMLQMMKEEYASRVHEQDVRRKSLKEEQAARLKSFDASLKQGEKPAASLWPN